MKNAVRPERSKAKSKGDLGNRLICNVSTSRQKQPLRSTRTVLTFFNSLLGGMLVEYGLGNGIFTIGCLGEAFKPSSNGSFVALEVENLDAAITQLEAKGVKFAVGITELPTSRFALILDPDGNKIMVHKRKE